MSKPKLTVQPNNLDEDSDGFLVIVKTKWDLKPVPKTVRPLNNGVDLKSR